MTNVVGLKCDTATLIAHTPPPEFIDVVLNQLNGDDIDIYAGIFLKADADLSTLDIFPALESSSANSPS
jgi:hypothetical protein